MPNLSHHYLTICLPLQLTNRLTDSPHSCSCSPIAHYLPDSPGYCVAIKILDTKVLSVYDVALLIVI